MIIDSHTHLFPQKIISGVSSRRALVEELDLDIEGAKQRSSVKALINACQEAQVEACLVLPTAAAEDVPETNRRFQKTAQEQARLYAAGTLHPACKENASELKKLEARKVRALKFCTFSQEFGLKNPETERLFDLIETFNHDTGHGFFAVLDTFYKADTYFGTSPQHLTTPAGLGRLVRKHGEIVFVGAHMGGLCAPFDEIVEHLPPAPNLYLETSNAAHTLKADQFVQLLELHGPQKILFGTDWPWFHAQDELERIDQLMNRAGFDEADKQKVLYGNIAGLMGLPQAV
jgi:predicted TIM-barrel fold metal-dependent hydrolase